MCMASFTRTCTFFSSARGTWSPEALSLHYAMNCAARRPLSGSPDVQGVQELEELVAPQTFTLTTCPGRAVLTALQPKCGTKQAIVSDNSA